MRDYLIPKNKMNLVSACHTNLLISVNFDLYKYLEEEIVYFYRNKELNENYLKKNTKFIVNFFYGVEKILTLKTTFKFYDQQSLTEYITDFCSTLLNNLGKRTVKLDDLLAGKSHFYPYLLNSCLKNLSGFLQKKHKDDSLKQDNIKKTFESYMSNDTNENVLDTSIAEAGTIFALAESNNIIQTIENNNKNQILTASKLFQYIDAFSNLSVKEKNNIIKSIQDNHIKNILLIISNDFYEKKDI